VQRIAHARAFSCRVACSAQVEEKTGPGTANLKGREKRRWEKRDRGDGSDEEEERAPSPTPGTVPARYSVPVVMHAQSTLTRKALMHLDGGDW
jgi:hypothetical protein